MNVILKNVSIDKLDDIVDEYNSTFHTVSQISHKSRRKPNAAWVDQGSAFYNKSMKSWLQDNKLEIHSTDNEGKSVVCERFIETEE